MIANLARKDNCLSSADSRINIYSKPSDTYQTNQKLCLSYRSYFKNSLKSVSTHRHESCHVPQSQLDQFEYAENGSYVRLRTDIIDPYITNEIDYENRRTRGVVKGFSKLSRNRFLALCARINQAKVNSNEILFITLTAPSEHWKQVTWQQWKARLNNFNTQLRQKFQDTDMCGIWRMEFQVRGAIHFHICLFKVTYLDHEWVAKTWNNICCKNMDMSPKAISDHRKASTAVELARDWRAVGSYFNKTLAYLAKDIVSVVDPNMRKQIEQFGRHWGYINKKNLDNLTKIVLGDFQTQEQSNKVRRWTKNFIRSQQRAKFDRIKKSSDMTKIKTYYCKKEKKNKPIVRDGKVVKIRVDQCNSHHKLNKKLSKLFNARSKNVNAFITDKTFLKMLELADVDIKQAIDDSKNRFVASEKNRN